MSYGEIMRENFFSLLYVFIFVVTVFSGTVSAQFPIKMPKLKVEKPKTEQTTKEGDPSQTGSARSGSFDILTPPRPDATPRFLRDSVEISVRNESRYWKFPKQDHHHRQDFKQDSTGEMK